MKKKIFFSKKYESFEIKSDYYNYNNINLNYTKKINKKYLRQPKRTKCKNCNSKIQGFDFNSFRIDYKFCNKCNHLNGIYQDTDEFVNFLYSEKKGENYYKHYFNDFDLRLEKIYTPKIMFLKKILKNKKINLFDLGSGAGHFLKACELSKIKAIGYEPNKILCELARKKLKKNKIENIQLDEIYYLVENSNANCISLIGVLEHLQDPHRLLKSFAKSSIKYIYLSLPLFSFSVLLETMNKEVFPRQLGAAHTHLYTEESINYLTNMYQLDVLGEWWFGTDIADLYRHFYVKSSINKKNKYDNYLKSLIDNLQNVIDRRKVCSEVHIIAQKK